MSGFQRIATRERLGMTCFSSSSRFPLSSGDIALWPVMFPAGRAKLATNPVPTGSVLLAITIGIVCVCCLTAAIYPLVRGRHDDVRLDAYQFGRHFGDTLGPTFAEPALNNELLPFHVAVL